ncbi:MAG: hypothetical protein AMXMBFR64_44940 [Myxococcales bacterium]
MERREYETMFLHEDVHWWFVGTRRVILALAERELRGRAARVLDVGCGTGATLAALARVVGAEGDVRGVEPDAGALEFCARRGLSGVVQGRAEALPFDDGSFDLVLALDVIEHIEDDAAAVRELARVTRPGGAVLVTVPAHPLLWSRHDEALHHVRRYRRGELVRVLRGAGLRIETLSWYNTALLPVVAAVRLGQRAIAGLGGAKGVPRSDVSLPPRPVNAALGALLGAERHLIGRLPFGVSLIALARR